MLDLSVMARWSEHELSTNTQTKGTSTMALDDVKLTSESHGPADPCYVAQALRHCYSVVVVRVLLPKFSYLFGF